MRSLLIFMQFITIILSQETVIQWPQTYTQDPWSKSFRWPYLVDDPRKSLQCFYPNFTVIESSDPTWKMGDLVTQCPKELAPQLTAPTNNQQPNAANGVFAIDRLVDFNNAGETLTMSAVLLLHWTVTSCNPVDQATLPGSREKIYIPDPSATWLPNYLFVTASNDIYMQSSGFGLELIGAMTNSLNYFYKKLDFYLVRRGFYSASCELDLAKFPFDKQNCDFAFSLKQPIDAVYFSNLAILCPTDESNEWRFTSCNYSAGTIKFQGIEVGVAHFSTELARKPSYYIINLVLPNLALSLLELACYLMQPDRPDRPIFAITILLALTVAQSQVLRGMPRTSQAILLGDYTLMLTCCAALTTLYHLFACLYATRNERGKTTKICLCQLSQARSLDLFTFLAMVALFVVVHIYAAKVAFF